MVVKACESMVPIYTEINDFDALMNRVCSPASLLLLSLQITIHAALKGELMSSKNYSW